MNKELTQILQDTGGTLSVFCWAEDDTWRATFLGDKTVKVWGQPDVETALAYLTAKIAGRCQ